MHNYIMNQNEKEINIFIYFLELLYHQLFRLLIFGEMNVPWRNINEEVHDTIHAVEKCTFPYAKPIGHITI